MTALFVSHGSPMLALETDGAAEALRRLGAALPRPAAVVVVSAHWEAGGAFRVTASGRPPTIHDFGGFPEDLYRLRYPAPGDPVLAREILRLLGDAGLEAEADPVRGLDHGAWIPLSLMFPAADVPVVQVGLPRPSDPGRLLRAGRALAPLRDRGVLLVGSGGWVHNLGRLAWEDRNAPVEPWARRFEDWVRGRVEARDAEALRDHRSRSADSALAAPTTEHFDPIFFVLGAARDGDRLADVHEGFQYGSLSMRTVSFSGA